MEHLKPSTKSLAEKPSKTLRANAAWANAAGVEIESFTFSAQHSSVNFGYKESSEGNGKREICDSVASPDKYPKCVALKSDGSSIFQYYINITKHCLATVSGWIDYMWPPWHGSLPACARKTLAAASKTSTVMSLRPLPRALAQALRSLTRATSASNKFLLKAVTHHVQ